MSLSVHCLVVRPRWAADPRSAGLLADARALGLMGITGLECHDLYFLEGDLSESDRERLAAELLCDPVAQTCSWRSGPTPAEPRALAGHVLEVALRPGVTDPVAEQIVRSARVLGVRGVERAATGQRYLVRGDLGERDLQRLARGLLANPVIHRHCAGEIEPAFPHPAEASGRVEVLPVRDLDDAGLLALSRARRAALDADEMRAIRAYFRAAGRDPTDVEFETLAQTWSEHCVHKTFKAILEIADPDGPGPTVVDGLLRTYIRAATEAIAAPWVRSAFVDNAGIIDFDDEHEVSFKVETHNHPSAIEPFGGANTGVGGVVRDILGVSAKPIAATDVLCFGPQDGASGVPGAGPALPAGALHPRRIRSGVVAGVQDYGNKIGVPIVNGAILYDEGFASNPLVFCGCVGLAPKGRHPGGPRPGDRVILLGGRTGRDGLRGATFSSMAMDAQTGEVAEASVQIGDPIIEKGLIEVVVRARDAGLYHAITDCGAGGLSSAVGEMASRTGAEVDLRRVRLKYSGLAPWEIWLSEAQERMVLAVPEAALGRLSELCSSYEVEMTDIGLFRPSGRLVVRHGSETVLDLANEFLHHGRPQRVLAVTMGGPRPAEAGATARRPGAPADLAADLLTLLAHPNIASKADVIRRYDHEVQGGTVIKPLTGAANDGPSDACVIKPAGTAGRRGIVLSNGINPEFGKRDPYRMAVSVVDEAVRNAVAVGADPDRLALLDNFCWGDVRRPETLGSLVSAARGCHDAALHHGAPFISGKDSLNNEYLGADGRRHAIAPTLLISAIGVIEDVSRAVTMDLKEVGDLLYLAGETRPELGGSHLELAGGTLGRTAAGLGSVPGQAPQAPALYRALHQAMLMGVVRAAHDLSEGGLAVAAAEMSIGGRLGLALELADEDPVTALFSESNGRLLVEVRPADEAAFEACFAGRPGLVPRRVGTVTAGARLEISAGARRLVSLAVADLVAAWTRGPAVS